MLALLDDAAQDQGVERRMNLIPPGREHRFGPPQIARITFRAAEVDVAARQLRGQGNVAGIESETAVELPERASQRIATFRYSFQNLRIVVWDAGLGANEPPSGWPGGREKEKARLC